MSIFMGKSANIWRLIYKDGTIILMMRYRKSTDFIRFSNKKLLYKKHF